MKLYVETNFILEMVFVQDECADAEALLELAARQNIQLCIPAFAMVEPLGRLGRVKQERQGLHEALQRQISHLKASSPSVVNDMHALESRLPGVTQEELIRFTNVRDQLLREAVVIALDADVLSHASTYYDGRLSPEDATIFASVIHHLAHSPGEMSVFASRDAKAFYNPDFIDELKHHNCKLFRSFATARQFLESPPSAST